MNLKRFLHTAFAAVGFASVLGAAEQLPAPAQGERIVLLGNGLAERMQYFGHFETALHRHFPDAQLVVRNMGNQGDTPAFRPRPGRTNQWAFPGAEQFRPEFSMHLGQGHYASPDEWLTLIGTDTILAFFGFNESFDGPERVENFRAELDAFAVHTLAQKYNGASAPRLVLVSPIAFEDLSATQDLPDGTRENANLALYRDAVRDVARKHKLPFVDLFELTQSLYASQSDPLTINGSHLSDAGYRRITPGLIEGIYGDISASARGDADLLHAAVMEKAWFWRNDYRMLNGVHVHGRRYSPYGNVNYPEEIEKIRQMTALRDEKIWAIARGQSDDLAVDDAATRPLTPIETNFKRPITYLEEQDALKSFTLPQGYAIGLFASEKQFPDLRNPVQMSFDNEGRLWVSVLHSYPHYLPGGPRPDDKILIFEDTDRDGRADRQTVYADGLSLPIGFEIAAEGVYVSEEPNLMLLRDTDGDGRADTKEILLGGFDSHDTHHAISAYCADASGAFFMCEGRFLHSQVETPYGPVRCNDGGVWRYDPKSWRLERFSQSDYNNPWGVAFDEWGQNYISDASNGENYWALPLSVNVPYGIEIEKEGQFTTHRVRPTSGTEFLYSRHFPPEVQGDFLINNTIGFLGTKQHTYYEDGAGYTGLLRHDLVRSDDPNFRPVDLEIAPDGSLYIVDWHNALIGHMQHSARDPNRDVDHGRIYRVTYPSRPLVEPARIAGEPVEKLLDLLKAHEYRTRYRVRRELRGRPSDEVLPAVRTWVGKLDRQDLKYERHLLEGLWATWAQNRTDRDLLVQCLGGESHQLRAAAARVLRYARHHVSDSTELFLRAARDEHPRVRLEAVVAASWMDDEDGARIAFEAMKHPVVKWMGHAFEAAMITLKDDAVRLAASGKYDVAENASAQKYLAGQLSFKPRDTAVEIPLTNVPTEALELYKVGAEVYRREAHCVTCHQADGRGIPGSYPALIKNEWVEGEPERLIKLVLKGLWGTIEVAGETFDPSKGTPPMIGFGPLLTDEEIAGVLTFVRYSWNNSASPVTPDMVAKVRKATDDRQTFYMVEELLKEHPFR